MGRLGKIAFITAVLSALSLLGLLVDITNPAELQIRIMGETLLRPVAFTGLLLLCAGCLGAGLVLRKKSTLDRSLSAWIDQRLAVPWVENLVIAAACLVVLVSILPLINLLAWPDARFRVFLALIFPFLFLGLALALVVLASDFFRRAQKKIFMILGVSLGCAVIGIWLQGYFLEQLISPYPLNFVDKLWWEIGILILSLVSGFHYQRLSMQDRTVSLAVTIVTLGVFSLQWALWPNKLRHWLDDLGLYAPFCILGLPLLAAWLDDGWVWLSRRTSGKAALAGKMLTVVVLLGLATLYYSAAMRHAQEVNVSSAFSDQNAYITIIKEARRLNFQYTGDQNRMPGYPFFQALFYKPGMSDMDLFEQGKRLNILLSLVLLTLLYLVFLKFLSFFQATLLLLILAFGLFVFKAGYIQSELTFYFFSFLSFLLLLKMLSHPGWSVALAAGIVTGLAYYVKGTILLSLPLFIGIYVLKWCVEGLRRSRLNDAQALRKNGIQLLYIVITLAAFLAVVFPYIHSMKQRFGQYFYNVNTSVYIWLNDMGEAYYVEENYHYTERWPSELPPEQIPSLQNYLRTHTARQIFDRFWNGLIGVTGNVVHQFTVTNYPLSYAWIFLLAVFLDWRNALQTLKRHPYLVLFACAYFASYLAAFSWYVPLAGGRRFTYGLYIPFLFSLFVGLRTLATNQISGDAGIPTKASIEHFFKRSNLVLTVTLTYGIWLVINHLLFIDRYGS